MSSSSAYSFVTSTLTCLRCSSQVFNKRYRSVISLHVSTTWVMRSGNCVPPRFSFGLVFERPYPNVYFYTSSLGKNQAGSVRCVCVYLLQGTKTNWDLFLWILKRAFGCCVNIFPFDALYYLAFFPCWCWFFWGGAFFSIISIIHVMSSQEHRRNQTLCTNTDVCTGTVRYQTN